VALSSFSREWGAPNTNCWRIQNCHVMRVGLTARYCTDVTTNLSTLTRTVFCSPVLLPHSSAQTFPATPYTWTPLVYVLPLTQQIKIDIPTKNNRTIVNHSFLFSIFLPLHNYIHKSHEFHLCHICRLIWAIAKENQIQENIRMTTPECIPNGMCN
jgi:hypothetical protein